MALEMAYHINMVITVRQTLLRVVVVVEEASSVGGGGGDGTKLLVIEGRRPRYHDHLTILLDNLSSYHDFIVTFSIR